MKKLLVFLLLISSQAEAAHFLRQLNGDVTAAAYTSALQPLAMCSAGAPNCPNVGGSGSSVSLPLFSYVNGITNNISVPSEYPTSFVGTAGYVFEGGRDGTYLSDAWTYDPTGITGTITSVTMWAYVKISGSDGSNDNTLAFDFCAGNSGSEAFLVTSQPCLSSSSTWYFPGGNINTSFTGLAANGDMSAQWISQSLTGLSINSSTQLGRPIVLLQQGMDCGNFVCTGAPSPLFEIYSVWLDILTSSPSYKPNFWPMFF